MKEISGDDCFRVLDSSKPVFLYFSATWCGPCKKLTPLLEQVANKYKEKVDFYKILIDNDENEEICEKCQIKSVPTCYLIKDRSSLGHVVGADLNNIIFLLKKKVK